MKLRVNVPKFLPLIILYLHSFGYTLFAWYIIGVRDCPLLQGFAP